MLLLDKEITQLRVYCWYKIIWLNFKIFRLYLGSKNNSPIIKKTLLDYIVFYVVSSEISHIHSMNLNILYDTHSTCGVSIFYSKTHSARRTHWGPLNLFNTHKNMMNSITEVNSMAITTSNFSVASLACAFILY